MLENEKEEFRKYLKNVHVQPNGKIGLADNSILQYRSSLERIKKYGIELGKENLQNEEALNRVLDELKDKEINKKDFSDCQSALNAYFNFLRQPDREGIIYLDEISEPETLYEGAKKTVCINAYEREPKARRECIEHYGVNCFVCNFNFEKEYGDIGKKFIHVHHLVQLKDIQKEYRVDPKQDLRPVCPNCHAMLHKKDPPYTIEELKQKFNSQVGL